ncbi:helix-turn-helix domain-containing protein [Guyparkeria sp.]|uniref:helix-turn-helix domain-containing protein n=1 Tax=Guyparkeria sp. TaxID=2035736 RepID=UPI0039707C54
MRDGVYFYFYTRLRLVSEADMLIRSPDNLAGYFRDRRKGRALSQGSVAEDARLRQGTVSAFERSPDSTRLDTVFRLLDALDLELHVVPKEPSGVKRGDESGDQGWSEPW